MLECRKQQAHNTTNTALKHPRFGITAAAAAAEQPQRPLKLPHTYIHRSKNTLACWIPPPTRAPPTPLALPPRRPSSRSRSTRERPSPPLPLPPPPPQARRCGRRHYLPPSYRCRCRHHRRAHRPRYSRTAVRGNTPARCRPPGSHGGAGMVLPRPCWRLGGKREAEVVGCCCNSLRAAGNGNGNGNGNGSRRGGGWRGGRGIAVLQYHAG